VFNKGKLTPDHHRNRARNETLPLKVDRREKKKFYTNRKSLRKKQKRKTKTKKTLKKLKPAIKLCYECGKNTVQLPAIKKSLTKRCTIHNFNSGNNIQINYSKIHYQKYINMTYIKRPPNHNKTFCT